MRINRARFVSDLSRAMPGISTGTVKIEGADTFVFKGGHIFTYNSVISVDVKGSEDYAGLKGIVSAKEFYEVLTKLPSDEIEITADEKAWTVTDGKIKVEVNLLSIPNIFERFNSIIPSENEWHDIDSEDFGRALRVCSIPHNPTKFAGLFFQGKEVWSTNQSEINRYELKDEYPKFMISESAVHELLKCGTLKKVQYNKRWVQFFSEDEVVFSVRAISDEVFPLDLISKLVLKTKDTPSYVKVSLTGQFFEAMERALAFSNNIDGVETVHVTFGSKVSISSTRHSGSYEEAVEDMSLDCDEFALDLDAGLFLRTNGVFESMSVLSDGPVNTDSAVHILFMNGDFETGSLKLCSSVIE